MANLGKIVADFVTQLSITMPVGATTGTLQSVTDDDSVALANGVYYFTIDGNNSNKEYIQATITGTSMASIKTVSRQGTLTSGTARLHRAGALVEVTDFAIIKMMLNLLNGTDTFDIAVPLAYTSAPTLTPGSNQLATVAYVDSVTTAGAPSASTSTKGIVKISTAAVDSNNPIVVGDNDTRVPSQGENDAMAGGGSFGTPSSTNKYLTQEGSTDRIQLTLTEETSSGITTGVPVFMQSDGEASKVATFKNFQVAGTFTFVDRASTTVTNVLDYLSIVWLTQNKFVALYRGNVSTTYTLYVALGVVDDNGKVAISNVNSVDSSTTINVIGLCRLSDSTFVISYQSSSNTTKLVLGSLDSTNLLTLGSAVSTSVSQNSGSVSRLSDTSFIFGYVTPSAAFDATAVVGSVSGTTITLNTPVTIDTTTTSNIQVIGLSATQAIVSWSISGALKLQALNISGTTVTNGASTVTVASVQEQAYLTTLSSSKFAVAYNDSATTGNVSVKVATISGDTITLGSALSIDTYSANSAGATGIAAFGSDVVVSYSNDVSLPYLSKFAHVKISGTTATLGSKNTIAHYDGQSGGDPLFPTSATVNGFVTCAVATAGYVSIYTFQAQYNEVLMGVAKSAPVSNVVPIIRRGRTGSLYSGLTFGKTYLFNQDGTIAENGVVPGGVAISTTELLIS